MTHAAMCIQLNLNDTDSVQSSCFPDGTVKTAWVFSSSGEKKYVGGWRFGDEYGPRGGPHGNGEYYMGGDTQKKPNGWYQYVGEWKDGYPVNGAVNDANCCTLYKGEWSPQGLPHGNGEGTWADKSYIGPWKDGKPHGKGIFATIMTEEPVQMENGIQVTE